MTEDVVDILNAGANESTMLARVLRHVEDRPVAPRPEDFYAALKFSDELVVRLHATLSDDQQTPIDCRYRDEQVEYVHEFRDPGKATRDAFVHDVRSTDEIEVVHHRDSQFAEAWTCPDCGEENTDPDSRLIESTNEVRVTCPECSAVDYVPQDSSPPRGRKEVA